MGAFAVSAVAIAVLVVLFFDTSPVTVGAPKVVVGSASLSASAAGPATAPVASAQPTAGGTSGDVASAQPSAGRPAPTAAATTAAVAPTSSVPAHAGAIIAGKEARQHRIFVDGKNIGEGPGTYFVPCGAHTIKIGSSGKPRDIDLACGTSIAIP
jgi:hypothetical protein